MRFNRRAALWRATVGAALLTAASCSVPKVEMTELGPLSYIRRTGDIDIYTGRYAREHLYRKDFREIALLKADDAGLKLKEQQILDMLIEKAREIGADGIITSGPVDSSAVGQDYAGVFVEEDKGVRIIRGTAIRYVGTFDF